MTHTLTGHHLINGTWTPSPSSRSFQSLNPATGAPLAPPFSDAEKPQVDSALAVAQQAFDRSFDLPHRWSAQLLDKIADCINDLGDSLLDRAEQETALPRPRLTGERARTTNQLKMFASFVREGSWVDATIDTAQPDRKPAPRPDLRRMMRPRGPVVVFGASNFPFAFGVCGGDTASALAAGCPVITKGHPSHPGVNELCAAAVAEALQLCSLPAGLFALLQGKSHDLSALLVNHPATAAVGFTGSQKAGRALFNLAAARPSPIPVYAEMGSLNPLIILPGALKDRPDALAKDLAGSILLGGGQFCTKPGLILTLGNADRFLDALTQNIRAAAPVTMLNQGLRENFTTRVKSWPDLAGVTTRIPPNPLGHAGVTPGLYETNADSFLHQRALDEEAFGPAALVVRCDDLTDIKLSLQSVGGSLTGTIHAGAADDPRPILRLLEPIVGRIILNGFPTGVEVCHAIVHGGPYPATTDPGSTSVGTAAIRRFTRMIAYQDLPDTLLPPELQSSNPLNIERFIDGQRSSRAIS